MGLQLASFGTPARLCKWKFYPRTTISLIGSPDTNRGVDPTSVSEPFELEECASQIRGIITADIHKMVTSCGWGAPYEYKDERPTLKSLWSKKSKEQRAMYWAKVNTQSLDGLLGMRHELMGPEWVPDSLAKSNK
ncbi:hypothetical protein BGX27_007349 [Mortierella sp. AM989]|nr:hypothetical protein BGX27_007349 [Mortierella sp. AM989]